MKYAGHKVMGTLVAATAALAILSGCAGAPESDAITGHPGTGASAEILSETHGAGDQLSESVTDAQEAVDVNGNKIVVGTPNEITYGGEFGKAVDFTVTSVDRCKGNVRIGVEMQTSDFYMPTDHPFHSSAWIDDQGFTHTESTLTSAYECGDELAYAYSTEAGKKYKGYMFYKLPGNAKSLELSPMTGQKFTIDVTEK